jgi:ABC-type phosphate/phosphonate transport system substrate-binding protein
MTRNLAFLAVAALATLAISGCVSGDDIRIAYTFTDDDLSSDKNPQLIAKYIQTQTGKKTTLFQVDNSDAALQAVGTGQADVAFVDAVAGFFGWQEFDLEAIAADINSDGRDHYVANAIVRADSGINSFEQLRDTTSCHTGLKKSAGMFMPLGWMIGEGYADASGHKDELSSIPAVVKTFFGDAIIPESGGLYYSYGGALQCLSENAGSVAFVKDSTPTDYCGTNAASWCLPLDQYKVLQVFGTVPTHPVMVGPHVSDATRDAIQTALVSLEAGHEVLAVLEADSLVAINDTEAYLGPYATNLQNVPGMGDYINEKIS